MEYWSDASEDSDRFVQYLYNLDWLEFVELLPGKACEFSPAMCMKCEAFYRKPHIVSKTHNVSSNGSTAKDTQS